MSVASQAAVEGTGVDSSDDAYSTDYIYYICAYSTDLGKQGSPWMEDSPAETPFSPEQLAWLAEKYRGPGFSDSSAPLRASTSATPPTTGHPAVSASTSSGKQISSSWGRGN